MNSVSKFVAAAILPLTACTVSNVGNTYNGLAPRTEERLVTPQPREKDSFNPVTSEAPKSEAPKEPSTSTANNCSTLSQLAHNREQFTKYQNFKTPMGEVFAQFKAALIERLKVEGKSPAEAEKAAPGLGLWLADSATAILREKLTTDTLAGPGVNYTSKQGVSLKNFFSLVVPQLKGPQDDGKAGTNNFLHAAFAKATCTSDK
jgi:hypothetical protein